MTPAQIETARRAMELPGWTFSAPESHKMGSRRSQRGILWVRSSEPRGPWVPDLTDYSGATDGVLLRLLGPGWCVAPSKRFTGPDGLPLVQVYRSEWIPGEPQSGIAATIAEACCLCAIDLGRWPGGAL